MSGLLVQPFSEVLLRRYQIAFIPFYYLDCSVISAIISFSSALARFDERPPVPLAVGKHMLPFVHALAMHILSSGHKNTPIQRQSFFHCLLWVAYQ